MGQYRRHVFVCTSGKECPTQGAAEVFDLLKRGIRDAGRQQEIRVNHAGCLGQCGHGPMVAVYPEDTWYAGVSPEGAEQILREHLLGETPVETLRYVAPPGDHKKPKPPALSSPESGVPPLPDAGVRE